MIREDVLRAKGASREAVLNEARQAANSYVAGRSGRIRSLIARLPAPFIVAAGAAVAGAAWLAARLCGV